mgnify:CR=1 FL=1
MDAATYRRALVPTYTQRCALTAPDHRCALVHVQRPGELCALPGGAFAGGHQRKVSDPLKSTTQRVRWAAAFTVLKSRPLPVQGLLRSYRLAAAHRKETQPRSHRVDGPSWRTRAVQAQRTLALACSSLSAGRRRLTMFTQAPPMWDWTKLDLDHMVDTFDPTVKQVLLLPCLESRFSAFFRSFLRWSSRANEKVAMAQPQHDACFVVEGKRLYAERAVLCARSTFFAGMFGSSMKGSSR